MDVSVIIVNFNTWKLTIEAIQSVMNSKTAFSYEIILVDNSSSDDSVNKIKTAFPDITLIVNDQNLGFSKANNQGIRISKGRYILLLNSDTVIQVDTLQTMINFMDENPRVGASGCKVVLADGSLDKACRRGFPTPKASFYYAFGISKLFPNIPKYNQYQLSHLDPDKTYSVDCLVGAFMMVRKETVGEVGLLDEEFFMYGEDIDWCYRIKQGGWQIYYHPHTQIVHYKGASSRRKPNKIVYEFYRAMFLFHRKHYVSHYNFFTNLLVYLGIATKLAFAIVTNQIKRVR